MRAPAAPTPGGADLRFMPDVAWPDGSSRAHRRLGPLLNVYVRDPDAILVEISRPLRSG